MNWEKILKRKAINYSFLREAVEEIISTKYEFTIKEIFSEVVELYYQKIVENNYLSRGQARAHIRRITPNFVGQIVAKLGTHRRSRKNEYLEGKDIGQIRIWRRIE